MTDTAKKNISIKMKVNMPVDLVLIVFISRYSYKVQLENGNILTENWMISEDEFES